MGFKTWLIKKYIGVELKQAKKEAEKDNIGDDGRKQSAEIRRLRAKAREWAEKTEVLEAKKRYYETLDELRDYEEEENDEEADAEPDNLFNKFIQTMLLGQHQAPPSQVNMTSSPVKIEASGGEMLTEEQIKEYLNKIPKNTLNVLKAYDDKSLKLLIPKYMPNVSDEEMDKIIKVARAM